MGDAEHKSGDLHDDRHTLHKKPNVKDDQVASALNGPCAHEGYLEKLNRHSRWQKRWWEIRGWFIMYWASEKAATAKKQPDAAIFIPRIKNISHQLSELHLESSNKNIKLRSIEKTDTDKSADLKRWQEMIRGVIDKYAEESAKPRSLDGGTAEPDDTAEESPDEGAAEDVNPEGEEDFTALSPPPNAAAGTTGLVYEESLDTSEGGTSSSAAEVTDASTAAPPPPASQHGATGAPAPPSAAMDKLSMVPTAPAQTDLSAPIGSELPASSEKAAIRDKLPSDLQVRIVVGKKIEHHPQYAVTTTKAGTTHTGVQYRFGEWRTLNGKLATLGAWGPSGKPPVDFPRTYQRMKVGVRLTDNQVEQRCTELDEWVQAALNTPMDKDAADEFASFLRVTNQSTGYQELDRGGSRRSTG